MQKSTLLARMMSDSRFRDHVPQQIVNPFPVPKIYAEDAFLLSQQESSKVGDIEALVNTVMPFDNFWIEGVITDKTGVNIGINPMFQVGGLLNSWRVNSGAPSHLFVMLILRILGAATEQAVPVSAYPGRQKELIDGTKDTVKKLGKAIGFVSCRYPEVFSKAVPGYEPDSHPFPYRTNKIPDFEWLCHYTPFLYGKRNASRQLRKDHRLMSLGQILFTLKENIVTSILLMNETTKDNEDIRTAERAAYNGLYHSLFALNILACKNVELADIEMLPPRKPGSKKREKKFTFKVLVVKPVSAPKKQNGEPYQGEKFKRLHLVRGYRADYTKGKGLFGKYHGWFYMPSHMRGTTKYGAVFKDYKVES